MTGNCTRLNLCGSGISGLYRTVAELIYGVNATIMFGTDTFLAGYARVAHPYDFRSLRYLVGGAEPVKVSAPI